MAEIAVLDQTKTADFTLRKRIAIVTGSDSGIGQAVALALAHEGADVTVTFHSDEAGASSTADGIVKAGQKSVVQRLDVTNERSVSELFEVTAEKLGTPDILVNCAGIGAGGTDVADLTSEAFDRVVKADLYGPFYCCREFVRRRKAAGGHGKIINITSVHEAIPSPGSAAYGAAKGGLLTFTRSLALEVSEWKINVNAIAPGLIKTPMTAKRVNNPEKMAKELPNIPWRRPGEPWEVARLAVYLASADADYVTGQSFTIDGGLEMNWGQGA
jgi:glucose 1-dehydrogenase